MQMFCIFFSALLNRNICITVQWFKINETYVQNELFRKVSIVEAALRSTWSIGNCLLLEKTLFHCSKNSIFIKFVFFYISWFTFILVTYTLLPANSFLIFYRQLFEFPVLGNTFDTYFNKEFLFSSIFCSI